MKPHMLKRNSFWLVLSVVLMVLSSIVASVVQTSGYSVDVKTMRWETASGESESALLFKPNGVTADNKAPALVLAHGWWNNKEMQDANFVELARRGYVVIALDMYGHGNSDYVIADNLTLGATGTYDAVLLATTLPYVDQDKIGVSGHSNGARSINFAMNIDNAADEQLIDAAYFVDFDPQYTDPDNNNEYFNLFGDRDIGLNADQYDDFFFRSFNAQGEELTPPREYIGTPNAQSFLHYGADPTTFTDERKADTTTPTVPAAPSESSTRRRRSTRGARSRSTRSLARSISGRGRSAHRTRSIRKRRPGRSRRLPRRSASSASRSSCSRSPALCSAPACSPASNWRLRARSPRTLEPGWSGSG